MPDANDVQKISQTRNVSMVVFSEKLQSYQMNIWMKIIKKMHVHCKTLEWPRGIQM